MRCTVQSRDNPVSYRTSPDSVLKIVTRLLLRVESCSWSLIHWGTDVLGFLGSSGQNRWSEQESMCIIFPKECDFSTAGRSSFRLRHRGGVDPRACARCQAAGAQDHWIMAWNQGTPSAVIFFFLFRVQTWTFEVYRMKQSETTLAPTTTGIHKNAFLQGN